jgi:hypothetical protein
MRATRGPDPFAFEQELPNENKRRQVHAPDSQYLSHHGKDSA